MDIRVVLVALIAAITTLLLPLYFDVGPDLVQNITLVQCFSSQLWQGDWYPRWCEATNAGYGSPIFLAYYPLSYYITAIFWPLKALGLGIKGMIFLSALGAGVVAFLTCWFWLREISNHKIALLCAFMYLWIPYRMEVLLFRPSLSELWLISFLPLLFHFARGLVRQVPGSGLKLSLMVAVCLLTQIPTTLDVLFILGIYVVLLAWPKFKPMAGYGIALLAGGIIALFYLAPASYYQQFLSDEMAKVLQEIWVCRHMLLSDIWERPYVVLNFVLTAMTLSGFAWLGLKRLPLVADTFVCKEYKILLLCSLAALFMLLPVSKPVWDVWRATGVPGMPWRMQFIIGIVLVYAVAIYARWQISEKRKKTTTGDYMIGMFALVFFSMLFVFQHSPEEKQVMGRIVAAQAIQFGEHFPRWVDKEYREIEDIVERHEEHPDEELAVLAPDAGKIVGMFSESGKIHLSVELHKDSVLTLHTYYFPTWLAHDEKGNALEIKPTKETGLVSLELKKGNHDITISRNVYQGNWLVEWCRHISLAAFLIWLGYFISRRNVSKAAT